MKKIDSKIILDYLKYKQPTEETVFNQFVLNLLISAITILITSNYKTAFFLVLPFMIINSIIFLIFKFTNINVKKLDLLCSIMGIISVFIIQCCAWLYVPNGMISKVNLIILFIILNIIMLFFSLLFCLHMLKKQYYKKKSKPSIVIISLGSALGVYLSKNIDSIHIMPICIFILSLITLLVETYLFISRLIFSLVLTKRQEKTGDGSMS